LEDRIKNWETPAATIVIVFLNMEAASCFETSPITTLYILTCSDKTDSSNKGKTTPLQAWTGPEGSRRLRLPDFKTVGT